ncbi:MAG: GMC family oxidoreductase [Bacteroidetes bacterium]|nr:GMC family oxidoreductase [Bacteroidota bacterium]MDA1120903.1 GMC family oxidoreductase [Bacteroidota bacterium]
MVNIISKADRTYDAIVIGSGMSGGWSAKELTEKGLKTLLLERGREVVHIKDYPTSNMYPFEFEHRGKLPLEIIKENPIVSKNSNFNEYKQHLFVKDKEHPYIQSEPFGWIRGYQTGGRSLMWGRMVQRWSDYDFDGPARDGFAVDWPIRYKDLAPWYSHVEKFIGVSGNRDGLKELPDGEFLPPMEMTAAEEYFKASVAKSYNDRHVIMGRCAHITGNFDFYAKQGRGRCQYRDLCRRGCPFGGYFSSNSSTIPWAMNTGNLTIRHHSVVDSILYDEEKGKASGVKVIDSQTMEEVEYYAKIIFVNAGSINTNLILLNSKSSRFPNGFGNDNELMGRYIAFHNYRAEISAQYDGLKEYRTEGRRPSNGYIPRFRNVKKQETDFLRGYASTFRGSREISSDKSGVGEELKESLLNPEYGSWRVGSGMMGETIPKHESRVILDKTKKDQWGIPLLDILVQYDDNDEKMIQDFHEQFTEMYEKAGFTNIKTRDNHLAPGFDIHEMGGVRMGRDPKTSLLNGNNQLHACKNVFVTDGACMTSTSTQNPSLTYMAITARAANIAVEELNKRKV